MNDGRTTRRTVLGAGATALTGLAGCSSITGGAGGVRLAGLRVTSPLDDAHEVSVRLTRDGETVLDRRFAVGGDDGSHTVRADWDTDPATYELTYAVAGPEVDLTLSTASFDGGDAPEGSDCAVAWIAVPGDEALSDLADLRPASDVSGVACP